MNSIEDGSNEKRVDHVSLERETASLIAMLWFVADRVRNLGYTHSADAIDQARLTFTGEISNSE